MKNIILMIIGMLFTTASFADDNFDLKCTLDDGVKMTVSHGSNTVYIAFFAPGDDPDEGGGVIKLDIPSGEVKQDILYYDGQIHFFGLRGDSPDSDDAVVVSFLRDTKIFLGNEGVKHVYTNEMTFISQNKMTGKNIEDKCIPDTIRLGKSLTEKGIHNVAYIQ
ncbi:hypothetical protein [Providencia alcalifaciens]|uniref:hypothetical protein n=1 Tax=Providencia alcalifaciens TaxID=126385 RepID=UPI00029C523E|nr:hypothetical protein [Providencia alcalifaciens]EKT65504.1 hypothetical protein OO9_11831 [Providencia alcalifaciens Dmel2]